MKDRETVGNRPENVSRILVLIVIVAAPVSRAEACPPAVSLTGDETLVIAVRDLLGARGITDATPRCPAVHASVEHEGDAVIVGIDGPDGVPVVRTVNEVATAATVIESWTRTDVAAPLLASHALPPDDARDLPRVRSSSMIGRNLQIFGAAETSIASDQTGWLGATVGMCINLDPICLATRLRFASVAAGPAQWDGLERHNKDILVGLDIPIAVHGMTLSPGFAAGIGSMHTHMPGMPMGTETGGLRAEIHTTLSIPLTSRIAIDLSLTADMTQATHIEIEVTPSVPFPDEPRALVRFGAGVRYGGL